MVSHGRRGAWRRRRSRRVGGGFSLGCFLALLNVVNAAVVVSPEAENEAIWRLGYWWNQTWCALQDPRNFSTRPFKIPHDSVLVLPDGGVGEIVLPVHGRRYNQDRSRLSMDFMPHLVERVNSYGLWRYAADAFGPDWARGSAAGSLDYIAVTALDGCGPSHALPLAAHCRGSVFHLRNGLVMWPGLRQGTAEIQGLMREAQAVDSPWEEKMARAVWRGGTSGDATMQAKGRPVRADRGPLTASRFELVKSFREDPLFDVGFSDVNQGQREQAEVLLPLVAGRLTQEEQLRYKVIIAIDGNTCSSVITWALGTRSVIAMIDPLSYEAPIQYGLQPWVHFIPYSRDLSDLRQNIQWCFENDAACSEISENARRHVSRLLDPDHERRVQAAVLRRIRDLRREDCVNTADEDLEYYDTLKRV